ncbi:MAG: hypothetical protein K8L99_19955 [Anaerolineae bacterium]|nr:hypothetical protein [Anaerolineae bacterium]
MGSSVQAQGSPEGVVTRFLDSWKGKNYQEMYNLISTQSQELYSFPVFETNYTTVDSATGMTDLTYEITEVKPQGQTTAVTYDLTLSSAIYSPIVDPQRVMRLVQTSDGWRVAWSTMDIFDGIAAGTQLRSVGQRDTRANIYDRQGDPVVEENGTVAAIYLQRQTMFDEAGCIDLISTLLRRQRSEMVTLFGRFLPDAVFYVGDMDVDVYNSRQQDLIDVCGTVRTSERQTRHYYRGNAVSHVTGYVGQLPADDIQSWLDRGYQPGDLIGRLGIELAFEDVLSGQAESLLRITDSSGTVIRELGSTTGSPSQPVMLTIDRDLQLAVAQALADAFNFAGDSWGSPDVAPGGAAIVMDIHSGAILAMSSYPLYEPDIFNPDTECCGLIPASDRIAEIFGGDSRRPIFNRALQGEYTPGSVFKVITLAATSEEGIWGPDQIFPCTLTWDGTPYGDTVGYERKDWRFTDELEPAGDINMQQALTTSCNPFFWQMGAQLFNLREPGTLDDYARRMGFGSPTGIDYYGTEADGNLPVPANPSEAINEAIGQGDIQVTLMQMVRMVAGIANGGKLYKPYLVQRVGGMDGMPLTQEFEPEVVGEMNFSDQTMKTIYDGMCQVTQDEFLGTAVWPFEDTPYWVCGKTGTAQTGRYSNAWFIAFAPAEDPQIAVAVLVEQAGLEGSQVAAPITRRIMDFYFNAPFWNYPPLWLDPFTPLTVPEGAAPGA